MPPRNRIPIAFGAGLDRESGAGVVQPGSFADLRNCHLHEGKVVLRGGFTAAGVGEFAKVDILLAGQTLRTQALGIVVGWSTTEETCYIYRVEPDLSVVQLLGEWENDQGWGSEIPRVIMASVYGRVFIAHDQPTITDRAPTVFYDSTGGAVLKTLTSDWADGTPGESAGESAESTDPENFIRFRGVVRHLSYLFGWGFGTAIEPRPELVRVSLPDDPTTFELNNYFIAGDRQDDVIACGPVGGFPGLLKVWKRQETYDITGTGRASFGVSLADPRYGLIASRAWVQIGDQAVAWSEEGPRLWSARGESSSLEIPLGLDDWEPSDLVDEGEEAYAFAHYVPRERAAWFHFNRRVYALTTRVRGRWRWSYHELPFNSYGGFTLFEGEGELDAPAGFPEYVDPEGGTIEEPAPEVSLPTAGMYAHYAADELVGFADTDPVTSWPDLSPNGRDLSPVSAPFFSTGEINGLPAVRFDGVDDAFGILAQPRPGSTAITIWAIYYYVSGISSLVSWRQGGSNLLETHMPFNDGNFYFDHGNIGGGGRISGAAPGGFAGAYRLMELYKPDASGGGAYIAVDGVTAVSDSFTDALDALGTAELRIMGNAGNFTSGRLAELIIYETAQSLEDRDATRAYLANKYGISVP